jgi:hypothetical protein
VNLKVVKVTNFMFYIYIYTYIYVYIYTHIYIYIYITTTKIKKMKRKKMNTVVGQWQMIQRCETSARAPAIYWFVCVHFKQLLNLIKTQCIYLSDGEILPSHGDYLCQRRVHCLLLPLTRVHTNVFSLSLTLSVSLSLSFFLSLFCLLPSFLLMHHL